MGTRYLGDDRFVAYDQRRGKHLCRIGGPGDPVVETDTMEQMLAFLNAYDIRVTQRPRRSILDVFFRRKEQDDADSDQEIR